MLKNYKNILFIAIAVFVVFAVGIMLMPKREMVVGQNKKDGSEQMQTEQKELMAEQDQTQMESEQVKKNNSDDQYKGVVTKEDDGWKSYKNDYFGIEFNFPLNYDIEDRLVKQENLNSSPWYLQPDFLLARLIFRGVNKNFYFTIVNTIDDERIKASDGWEICEKENEEKINGNLIKNFSIDNGNLKMKVISNNRYSFIFRYSNREPEEDINLIISTFRFIK